MLINIFNWLPKSQQFGSAGCALSLAALEQWAEGWSGRQKGRKALFCGQIQQIASQVLLRVDQRVRASHRWDTHAVTAQIPSEKCPVHRKIIQGKTQKQRELVCPTTPAWAALLRLGDKSCPRGKGIPSEESATPLTAPVPTDRWTPNLRTVRKSWTGIQ